MEKEIVSTDNAPNPPASYSQAVKAGGFVFVSGQGPFDPKTGEVLGTTIQEQTAQCLRNVETILRAAGKAGRLVVVAENHTVIGGLGEAVAGLLMRSGIHPIFRQIGLPDAFLDAGALPTLHDQYGISAAAVAKQIKGWL